MKAFSKGITKAEFLAELKAHQLADNFLQGTYSKEGKGCAVGCSIKSIAKLTATELKTSDHSLYEKYLDLPEWLAHLEDRIFEGLPVARAKQWPVEFTEIIMEGADVNSAKVPFIIFLLESNIETLQQNLQSIEDKNTQQITRKVIEITEQMIAAQKAQDEEKITAAACAAYVSIRTTDYEVSSAVYNTARSAAYAADYDAAYAADAACFAIRSAYYAAYYAADDDADSIASASGYAADAARSVAHAAYYAADVDYTASAADDATRSATHAAYSASANTARSVSYAAYAGVDARFKAYEKQADKLLELLREQSGD